MTQMGFSLTKGAKTLSSSIGNPSTVNMCMRMRKDSISERVPTLEGLGLRGYRFRDGAAYGRREGFGVRSRGASDDHVCRAGVSGNDLAAIQHVCPVLCMRAHGERPGQVVGDRV